VPIGADLILHEQPDPGRIRLDSARLGEVVAEAARQFATPLAFPVMDLTLEKVGLVRRFGVADDEAESFRFSAVPSLAERDDFFRHLTSAAPTARVAANLGAIQQVGQHPGLLPIGMSIGPFSLASKLMADPITPVYLAGSEAEDGGAEEIALLEFCLEVSLAYVLRYLDLQIAAGAEAVFIAEPAANKVYFSPKQIAAGSDIFARYALAPNRRIAERLAERGVELMFHCCGELTDEMLDGICALRPALLSLGSSRRLWEDAARVPGDVALYGNLPSKQFYSDSTMPLERVGELAADLAARMAATGHPFILGTECDVLAVPGAARTILGKVRRMLQKD